MRIAALQKQFPTLPGDQILFKKKPKAKLMDVSQLSGSSSKKLS